MNQNVAIVSVGKYIPSKVLSNNDLEKMVETSDDWISSRTGMKQRRISSDIETTSFMATEAAKQALHNANVSADQVELIIVATVTPDSNFPAVGCLVQKNIGAVNAVAFDVSAACSGFLCALTTAKQFLKSGIYKNALIIGAEQFSKIVDWNDRNTCVLFGDGAGAAFLNVTQSDCGILSEYMFSQGQYDHFLYVEQDNRKPLDQSNDKINAPFVVMKGQELFKIAVNSMAQAVEIAIEKANLTLNDIDCVIPHQANDRIISAVVKKLNVPKDKVFVNVEKYGNTSAASIPVALCEAFEQKIVKKGDTIVLVAFGAGLFAAANVVKL